MFRPTPKYFLPLLLQLLLALPALAQQPLETYTPANGLVDARVRRMVQDQYGRLWFLTREGFSCYDGQRFINYLTVNGHSVGIAESYFFMPDSTLYIAGGSTAFRITRNSIEADTMLFKGVQEISEIITLRPGDYIAIANNGLFRITNGRRTQLHNRNPRFTENLNFVAQVAAAGGPYLVFSFWQGAEAHQRLYLYDYEQQQLLDWVPAHVSNLQRNGRGQVWVNTGNGCLLVNTAALQQQQLHLLPNPWQQQLPAGFAPLAFLPGFGGTVFCTGTNNQLAVLQATGAPEALYTPADGLFTGITNVFTDRENNHWLIATYKGVQKIVQSPYHQVQQLYGQAITAPVNCYEVPGKGLYVNNGSRQWLFTSTGVQHLPPPAGSAEHTFYWNSGLWSFTGSTTITTPQDRVWKAPAADSLSPLVNVSGKVLTDSRGNLVISGSNMYMITRQDSVLAARPFYFTDKIAEDGKGHYWAFTRGDVADCFTLTNNNLVRTASFATPDLAPRCAIHWSNDTFLVGTRQKGLVFVQANQTGYKVLSAINRNNGLGSNFVLNCVRLKNGKVLTATASGADLVTISREDTAIQHLSPAISRFDPLLLLAVTGNDDVYVINELRNSLFLYQGSRFNTLPAPSRAWLQPVLVNGRPLPAGTDHFNYRQNNFQFTVSAPSFIDNSNINFHFLLTGHGDPDAELNNTGMFTINNLEPGSYRLQVKVTYPGGIYPNEWLYYHFTITKPFWKTAGFIALCAAVVIGLIVLFTRLYYLQQLRKREAEMQQQQAIERERTRIATDMHDDFGAGLSRIKFISEKVLLQHRGNTALQPDLEKISGYSDEMAEKMGEIVWALNQKYDTLGDLVAFCRAWASEYLGTHEIALQFEESVTDRQLMGETRRNLFLVLKECLHNTVKHAAATRVAIRFTQVKDELQVQIQDNGKGIDLHNIRPFANGLENMKKRVADCGGRMTITNNNGTQVHIQVTLPGDGL